MVEMPILSLLGFLICCCCFIVVDSASVTKFEAPESVYLGEAASFRCTFESLESSLGVYWQVREGTVLGPDINHNSDALTYQRYTIETDRTNNDSTLTIVNAEYSDSGNYSCFLSVSSNIVAKSEEVSFQVISQAPEDGYPKCYMNIDEDQVYREGDEASISCVSRGGIPPSSLRWEIDGSALIAAQSSAEDFTVYSNYSWSLVPENDGSVITCFESHIDFSEERFCHLSLQVEYGPVISTHIEVDGDSITFTCTATANPAQVSEFTWNYQGYDALEDMADRFEALDPAASMVKMLNVREDDLGNTIVCTANNSVGSTAASIAIPPKPEQTTASDGASGFSRRLSTLEIKPDSSSSGLDRKSEANSIIIVCICFSTVLFILLYLYLRRRHCCRRNSGNLLDINRPRQGRVNMAEDTQENSEAVNEALNMTTSHGAENSSVNGVTVKESFESEAEASSSSKPGGKQSVEDLDPKIRSSKTSKAKSVTSNENSIEARQKIPKRLLDMARKYNQENLNNDTQIVSFGGDSTGIIVRKSIRGDFEPSSFRKLEQQRVSEIYANSNETSSILNVVDKNPLPTEVAKTSDLNAANIIKDNNLRHRDNWEIPRNEIFLDDEKELGSGKFGKVYQAKVRKNVVKKNPSRTIEVAVKIISDASTAEDRKKFMQEIEFMKGLVPHPNIVSLFGCCTDTDPLYLILELVPNGNLEDFLRSHQSQCTAKYNNIYGSSNDLTHCDLLSFLYDVAKGMAHFSSLKCIHGDLATRNVLMGENKICKVSDFGFSKDVHETGKFVIKTKKRLPIRWMALESLIEDPRVYTLKSDVWSFGVLVWEIMTMASSPYLGIKPVQLIEKLKGGYRLPKPKHCSSKIYDLMSKCWEADQEKRISFSSVVNQLEQVLLSEKKYHHPYISIDELNEMFSSCLEKNSLSGEIV